MTCPYTTSGCNGPKEGDCMSLCLHRVDAAKLSAPVSVHMGAVEQRPAILPPTERISRPALALSTYRVYRTANRSRAEAFRRALRVLRQRT
jgi:hypothetical protein